MSDVYASLTKAIMEHSTIIIMGHRYTDYDGLGAALGLAHIIRTFHKTPYILIEEKLATVFNEEVNNKVLATNSTFIYTNDYKKYIDDNTLLLIIDTNTKKLLATKAILNEIKDKIVIDHHLKSSDTIDQTIFTYINTNLSSLNEFVVFYLHYLGKTVDANTAVLMLCGLEIDTNDFHTKTTANTFLAAKQLLDMGAEASLTMLLIREKRSDVLKRLHYMERSRNVDPRTIVCTLDEEVMPKDLAIVSESLLKLTGIERSFTIGKIKDNVGISARSIGNEDVEQLMTKLGGGGHTNEAGVQIKNTTVKDVTKALIQLLEVKNEDNLN